MYSTDVQYNEAYCYNNVYNLTGKFSEAVSGVQRQNVFLSTNERLTGLQPITGRINLRLGQPTTLVCYSNAFSWSSTSVYAEVSLHYCNDSNSRTVQNPCSSFSQYQPLFSFTPPDSSTSSLQYLSANAFSLSQMFQFSFPLLPDPYVTGILLRIPVRKVTSSFEGSFFCRITFKDRITSRNETNINSSNLIFNSDSVSFKPFGIIF